MSFFFSPFGSGFLILFSLPADSGSPKILMCIGSIKKLAGIVYIRERSDAERVLAYNTVRPALVMLDAVEVQVCKRVILPVLDSQEDLPGAVQVQPLLCEGFKCLLSDEVDI